MMPQKLKQQIDDDERYRYCFISNQYPAQIHHAIYGAVRPEAMWNYVPLHITLHTEGAHAVHKGNRVKYRGEMFQTREICELFAMARATKKELEDFGLLGRFEGLKSNAALCQYVLRLACARGFANEIWDFAKHLDG